MFFYFASYSQEKDSLVYEFGENMTVYKSINDGTFLLKKKNKIKFKNLKFTLPIWGYLQVLDENNFMFYIDSKGEKQQRPNISLNVCGTVPHYTCEIKEDNDKYIITRDETFLDYENKIPFEIIDSIKKEGINKIYFTNNLQVIKYDENDFVFTFTNAFPSAVIIEREVEKGILHQGKLILYDEIFETKNWVTKVRLDNKVGYYNLTEIKYSHLEEFVFGLAKFKIENGKAGYIDMNGKEYYD